MSNPRSLVKDVSQLSGNGLVTRKDAEVQGGFVTYYNQSHPNRPYRYKSAGERLNYLNAAVRGLLPPPPPVAPTGPSMTISFSTV